MRIVVASAPFKGTMTATQATAHLAALARVEFPGAQIDEFPMADGGDGTIEVLLAHGYAPLQLPAADALGRSRLTTAAMLDGVCVIELARTCGLHTIEAAAPRTASTLGLGVAMCAAMDTGAEALVIGLGGSASTDGGLGILRGLAGDPCAGLDELLGVHEVELPTFAIPITALVDVASPLTGPLGAAHAFGPQKGLDPAGCAQADAALSRWAALLGIDPSTPGSGAAGGAGAALLALGAQLIPGGPELARLTGLPRVIDGADLVVTGEGRLDRTSLEGKAPAAVAQAAAAAGVPCRIMAGEVEPGVADALGATGIRLG